MTMMDKYYQFREDIAESPEKKRAVKNLIGVGIFLLSIMGVLTIIYPATMFIVWCVLVGCVVAFTVINLVIDSIITLTSPKSRW